jgi:hypothetical protein
MNKPTVPFPRSYWVVPGKFLAGYYPGSRDSVTAQAKLKNLLEFLNTAFATLLIS